MAKCVITIQDVDDENIEINAEFDPPIDPDSDEEAPFTHVVGAMAGRFIAQLLSADYEDSSQNQEPGSAFSVEIPIQEG